MSAAIAAFDFGPFSEVISFLMEIDKLKQIQRRTLITGGERYENSAEHSWHFAVAAMSMAPYVNESIDIQRVIKMALLHDIVEIDTGDVLVYDLPQREAVATHEAKAAQRLFGLLPAPQSQAFLALWQEYEAGSSAEARFAGALDRLLPILLNLQNQGKTWQENQIRLEQVISRNEKIGAAWPELWQHLLQHLQAAQQKGWLR